MRWLAAIAIVSVCGACTDASTAPSEIAVDVSATVPIGVMPAPLSNQATLPPLPPAPEIVAERSAEDTPATSQAPPPTQIELPIADQVGGRRVMLIGDSLLESAAPRNDRALCNALATFGWEAEINALGNQSMRFVREVLDARLPSADATDEDASDEEGGDDTSSDSAPLQDWDVVALFFGNEIDAENAGDVVTFTEAIVAAVERLAPRPTILFTVSETSDARADLNATIRELDRARPNVVVIDWAAQAGDPDDVLDDGGETLTEDGRKRLSVITAAALGQAPAEGRGACLSTLYD